MDGFIADAQDQVGPLFDWYANRDVELVEGGALKVPRASAAYAEAQRFRLVLEMADLGFTSIGSGCAVSTPVRATKRSKPGSKDGSCAGQGTTPRALVQ